MNIMAKIAIASLAVAALGAAGAFFLINVPEGMANSGTDADGGKHMLRPAVSDTASRFEVAQAATPQTANQTSTLPGGASSLQESYQDWTIVCATQAAADGKAPVKRCAMTQQQTTQQGGQRVLAVELKLVGANFEASLFLPFGLALEKGVTLQIDDGQVTQPYRFRTCLPAGCLVPLTFDAAYITALQKGMSLKLKAAADGGADTPFAISLKGFGTATARLAALAK